MTHSCPCGCGAQVERAKLACRTGWFALPYELRRRLSRAWSRRDWPAHRGALAEAMAWFRDNADDLAARREADPR